jgi:anti-sigma factor ChrR (cupin superfamily)
MMNVHPNEDALNAYAEGSLTAADAAAIEQHVASCVSCRQFVDEVREILRATADLGLQDPPARAWTRIERAIQLEQADKARADGARADGARAFQASEGEIASGHDHGPAKAGRYRLWLPWLAAAAALVLATVVGLRYAPGRSQTGAPTSQAPDGSAQVSAGDAAQSVEYELRQAEAHYENAIKGLEQIANAEQNALDPRTAATLQKNLAVIDQAISESRAAVRSQPANEPAQQSLIENFKTKIALLQDTVALINEMRKGKEAGAARIVSGLKQKGN